MSHKLYGSKLRFSAIKISMADGICQDFCKKRLGKKFSSPQAPISRDNFPEEEWQKIWGSKEIKRLVCQNGGHKK